MGLAEILITLATLLFGTAISIVLAGSAVTLTEIRAARICLVIAALILAITESAALMFDDKPLLWRLVTGSLVGLIVFVGLPEALRWIKHRQALAPATLGANKGAPSTPNSNSKPPEPNLNLRIDGFVEDVNYPEGENVNGIKWQAGFSHVRLVITNPTTLAMQDLNIVIEPQYWIAQGLASSQFTSCFFGPTNGPPIFFTKNIDKNGKSWGSSQVGDIEQVVPSYRLVCDKLPSRASIMIDLAIVVMPPIGSNPGHLWIPQKTDPDYIDLHSNFTLKGSTQSDNSRIFFEEAKSSKKLPTAQTSRIR